MNNRRFEYSVLTYSTSKTTMLEIGEELNNLFGPDGWEVCGVMPIFAKNKSDHDILFWLKRELLQ